MVILWFVTTSRLQRIWLVFSHFLLYPIGIINFIVSPQNEAGIETEMTMLLSWNRTRETKFPSTLFPLWLRTFEILSAIFRVNKNAPFLPFSFLFTPIPSPSPPPCPHMSASSYGNIQISIATIYWTLTICQEFC